MHKTFDAACGKMMFGAPKRLGGYGWMDPGTWKKNLTNHAHLRIGGFVFFPKKKTFDFWGDDLLFLGRFVSFRKSRKWFQIFLCSPLFGETILCD